MISFNSVVALLFIVVTLPTIVALEPNGTQLASCDTLEGCYLMNSKTLKVVTKLASSASNVTSYVLDPTNDLGYSIRCNAKGKPGTSFDYVRFTWDGMEHIEWVLPAYMYGSVNEAKYINPVPYLGICGMKTVQIEAHIWTQRCLKRTIRLVAERADGKACDVLAPVPVPVKVPIAAPIKANTTKTPTKAPRRAPRTAPVKAPTKAPIRAPRRAPRTAPVKAPTKAPARAMTKSPTRAPRRIRSPVSAPVKTSTNSTTTAPVKSPTNSTTTAPVKTPTNSTTAAPVKAPIKVPIKVPIQAPAQSDVPPVQAPTKVVCEKFYIIQNGKCIFAPFRFLTQ